MRKYNILLLGAGSGGGNNLIRSLQKGSLSLNIIGGNANKFDALRSIVSPTYVLPIARSSEYIDKLNNLIVKEHIDLIIVSNITEMEVVSEKRQQIKSKVFLPHDTIMKVCNDKVKTFELFKKNDIKCAKFKRLESADDLYDFANTYKFEKYWVRAIRGAGSVAAAWFYTPTQAEDWLNLWINLRNMPWSDFMIEEFLPGEDYALQSVWKDGVLQVCKMIRRVEYVHMRNTLSGSSSSPVVAVTERNKEVIETALKAVNVLSRLTDGKPNGNFSMDFKENADGTPYITEVNIGRFCMITPIFDFTGKINTAIRHVECGLNLDITKEADPIDIEEDVYLLRGLDMEPLVVRGIKEKIFYA